MKVKRKAKIRNQYNQVRHLTQDIILESDKNTRKHHILKAAKRSNSECGIKKDINPIITSEN